VPQSCDKSQVDYLNSSTIIYTDIIPDTVINCVERYDSVECEWPEGKFLLPFPFDTINTFAIDIDKNGITDFELNVFINNDDSIYCWPDEFITITGINQNKIYSPGHWSYANCGHKLNTGDTIGNNLDTAGTLQKDVDRWSGFLYLYMSCPHKCDGYVICHGNYYVGVKLNKGNEIYYGWIQVDVDRLTCKVFDYACNATPTVSILAGEF